jgi:hypothetical protein
MAVSLDNSVDGFISLLAIFAVGLVCRLFQRKAVLICCVSFLAHYVSYSGTSDSYVSRLVGRVYRPIFFSSVLCRERFMIFAELAVESIALHMWGNAGSKFDEVTD